MTSTTSLTSLTSLTYGLHHHPDLPDLQVFDYKPSVTRWLLQPLDAAIRQTVGGSTTVVW